MEKMERVEERQALARLAASGREFITLHESRHVLVEVYKPRLVDSQSPHDRDECYLIISGTGKFEVDGAVTEFGPGDFLFVPAFAPHRFNEFTEDFVTWVLFVGPAEAVSFSSTDEK